MLLITFIFCVCIHEIVAVELEYAYISTPNLNSYTKIYNKGTFNTLLDISKEYVLCVPLMDVINMKYVNSPQSSAFNCVLTKDTSASICPIWLSPNYIAYKNNCIRFSQYNLPSITKKQCISINTTWSIQNIKKTPSMSQLYMFSKCNNIILSYCYKTIQDMFIVNQPNIQENIELTHNFTFCTLSNEFFHNDSQDMLISGMITISILLILILIGFYIYKPEKKQKYV